MLAAAHTIAKGVWRDSMKTILHAAKILPSVPLTAADLLLRGMVGGLGTAARARFSGALRFTLVPMPSAEVCG